MDALRAQARHARQRYDLYKAKAYGPRPTSDSRMRELQRESESAQARFSAAKAQERAFEDATDGQRPIVQAAELDKLE